MNQARSELTTIIEHFYHWEKEKADQVFLRQPYGDQWKTLSFAEAGEQARKLVSALRAKGLKKGDHIGLSSKNCMHWFIADLAIMMGGFVSVPFYPSLPRDQFAEVIKLADLKAVILGRHDHWGDKSQVIPDGMPVMKFPHYQGDAQVDIGVEWQDVMAQHSPSTDNFVPDLDDLWTILFTSGTTGTPKGVMHNHRGPASLMVNEKNTNWVGIYQTPEKKFFSFLPLNHVAERLGVEIPAITLGGQVSFAENLERFAANIKDTQPTFLFAVPRIWTLFYQGVLEKVPEKKLKLLLSLPIIGKRVSTKLREAIGLRDLAIAATGAAITPAFVKDFYKRLGIQLIEAYGMTETMGSHTNGVDIDTPSQSVGRVLPGAEVRIDPDTDEILMSSPYMMTGYYKSPTKTAEVLKDGWLHSGDIGRIDDKGYLYVTGRIKDAFKTAKGSFVTPNPLEEAILKNDFIEQVCVVGIGIPQPIALMNLSEAGKEADQQTVANSILQTVQELNPTRAKYERISTAIIQQEAWSAENGILTPTLKVKRSELDQRFAQDYLQWHEAEDAVIWS